MILRVLIDICLVLGGFFALAGTVGLLRMPDTLSRMQAATCISTLAVIFFAIAGAIYAFGIMHSPATGIKIIMICVMIIMINPVGAHAIAKGAYRSGIRQEKKMVADDFRRDFGD